MIINHFIAALSAFIQSVKYGSALSIKRKEWKRYLKKSISLGLCYAGFAEYGKLREAWMAGESAFLCCAYDVVTDWRGFDPKVRMVFENILRARTAKPEIQILAIELYEKELSRCLEDDGLDRGVVSLRFILKMMNCEENREMAWQNLDEIGQLLQIVDDVLDYEDDILYGDTNCLTSNKRNVYLNRLIQKFRDAETRRLFGNKKTILIKVIEKSRIKAKNLLKAEILNQEKDNLPSISLKSVSY